MMEFTHRRAHFITSWLRGAALLPRTLGETGTFLRRRMLMKLILHEVELNSNDVEVSKRFYNQLLGLATRQDQHGLKVLDSGVPGVDFDISVHHTGQTSVSFLTDDLEGVINRLQSYGASMDGPHPTHLGMTSVTLTDPDGHRVVVSAPTDSSPEWLKKIVK